jgi:hypothetical protein
MRLPKPALNAIYRANDGMRYMVLEVTDLPFIVIRSTRLQLFRARARRR